MIWKRSKGKCPDCSASMEEDWAFCPRCGSAVREKGDTASSQEPGEQNENDMVPSQERDGQNILGVSDIFSQIEKQMQEQFQGMDRMFGETAFSKPKIIIPGGGSGISISIHSGQGGEPKVSVRTFGNAKKLEPQIKNRLKIGPSEENNERHEKPRVTAEPEMKVRTGQGKTIYVIDLPDVKNEQNVRVNRLPNSIEIRAKAGNKLYFKLFEVQPELSIAEQRFSDGKLTLVLEK